MEFIKFNFKKYFDDIAPLIKICKTFCQQTCSVLWSHLAHIYAQVRKCKKQFKKK